jgi:2'-5' RNA ligase
MRAFVAVELPEDARAALARWQSRLKAAGADVAWTAPEHLHVTMRFLGEIDDVQRAAVERCASAAAEPVAPFDAALSAPGAFPSIRRPRVVWMGIGQGADALAQVAGALERGLAAAGIAPEDRGFVAHVTLGRVRSPRGVGRLAAPLEAPGWSPPAPFRIDHLTLFQSRLSSAGPTYTALRRFPFKNPGTQY